MRGAGGLGIDEDGGGLGGVEVTGVFGVGEEGEFGGAGGVDGGAAGDVDGAIRMILDGGSDAGGEILQGERHGESLKLA